MYYVAALTSDGCDQQQQQYVKAESLQRLVVASPSLPAHRVGLPHLPLHLLLQYHRTRTAATRPDSWLRCILSASTPAVYLFRRVALRWYDMTDINNTFTWYFWWATVALIFLLNISIVLHKTHHEWISLATLVSKLLFMTLFIVSHKYLFFCRHVHGFSLTYVQASWDVWPMHRSWPEWTMYNHPCDIHF